MFAAGKAYIVAFVGLLKEPGAVGLVTQLMVGQFALLVAFGISVCSFRARLREKDARIAELADERNEYKDLLFKAKGITRRTTDRQKK